MCYILAQLIRGHIFNIRSVTEQLGKIPWKRNRLSTPVFLGFPGGSDGKVSACNMGDLVSIPGLGWSPGESSWTEEPGGLQSVGSQRVRHDRATKHSTAHWAVNEKINFNVENCITYTNVDSRWLSKLYGNKEEWDQGWREENRKELDKNVFLIAAWGSTSNCKKTIGKNLRFDY